MTKTEYTTRMYVHRFGEWRYCRVTIFEGGYIRSKDLLWVERYEDLYALQDKETAYKGYITKSDWDLGEVVE